MEIGAIAAAFANGDSFIVADPYGAESIVFDEFKEEGEAEGETIIRKRERFSHELTLAYESGQIIELKETKEAKPGDEERS